MEFINKLRPVCNILPHHPRWENIWRTLKIYLSTWDAKHVLSYMDIMLARNIEIIYVNEFRNKFEYEKKSIAKPKNNEQEIKLFIAELRLLIAEDNINEVFEK